MSCSYSKPQNNTRKKVHFPFEIAIVTSSNNPVLLRDSTLNILKSYRIPFMKITIFLSNKEQDGFYKKYLLKNTYGTLHTIPSSNLSEYYNSIQAYYAPGTRILYVKDCIKYILELSSNKTVKPLKSLLALCKSGFSECEKANTCLWGLCPSVTGMKHTLGTSLNYISGNLWGCINPANDIKLTQDCKEDYERSIQYFRKYKSVVRLNMITAVTHSVVGMVSKNKESECESESEFNSAIMLFQKYPEYVSLKKSNSGKLLLRLREVMAE